LNYGPWPITTVKDENPLAGTILSQLYPNITISLGPALTFIFTYFSWQLSMTPIHKILNTFLLLHILAKYAAHRNPLSELGDPYVTQFIVLWKTSNTSIAFKRSCKIKLGSIRHTALGDETV
jgi:hypothetical protein